MKLAFSSLARRFLRWASKCRHKTTVEVYRHYFDRFRREVGDVDVFKLRPFTVSGWAKTWHQSQAIVRLIRWAVEDAGILPSNPLAYMKHPPKGQRQRTITKREQRKLFRAASSDLRSLLFAYSECWARPGELRAAKLSDLHPLGSIAKLRKSLIAGRATIVLHEYKNRKARRIPNQPRVILIPPSLGRFIARRLDSRSSMDDKIFLTSAGRPWTANALRCRLRRLRRRLGLTCDCRGENLVPYTFRHTGATLASSLGVRDRLLADILGHTEVATTARYQHLQTEHLRSALQKVWRRDK